MRVHVTNIMHVTGWTVHTSSKYLFLSSSTTHHYSTPCLNWTAQFKFYSIFGRVLDWAAQFKQPCTLNFHARSRFSRVFDLLWPGQPRTNVTLFFLMQDSHFRYALAWETQDERYPFFSDRACILYTCDGKQKQVPRLQKGLYEGSPVFSAPHIM